MCAVRQKAILGVVLVKKYVICGAIKTMMDWFRVQVEDDVDVGKKKEEETGNPGGGNQMGATSTLVLLPSAEAEVYVDGKLRTWKFSIRPAGCASCLISPCLVT